MTDNQMLTTASRSGKLIGGELVRKLDEAYKTCPVDLSRIRERIQRMRRVAEIHQTINHLRECKTLFATMAAVGKPEGEESETFSQISPLIREVDDIVKQLEEKANISISYSTSTGSDSPARRQQDDTGIPQIPQSPLELQEITDDSPSPAPGVAYSPLLFIESMSAEALSRFLSEEMDLSPSAADRLKFHSVNGSELLRMYQDDRMDFSDMLAWMGITSRSDVAIFETFLSQNQA